MYDIILHHDRCNTSNVPDDPKVQDICTPHNIQGNINRTKETEQNIPLTPWK